MPTTPDTLQKPVVLVGMMGAGKTAIGTALAKLLDVELIDSDEALVSAANMSIAEIFARDGEAFFRKRESEVLDRLLSGAPCILSTGGGAWLSPVNRQMIQDRGTAVWLKADLALLWSRVRHKTTRPLLQTDDPYGTLKEIFEARQDIYALADLVVEAQASYSIQQMADAVLNCLKEARVVTEKAI
ncbi:shikimate kinase [Litoreibacter roseus]|uniref:Shikimate kinase n=1 Tax=Litoreibacter roseus TaxID=2601869 RepID=A0A6N6JEQ7_9RHOB|nr:shikimate kinase [Litoreibacter roseus]GFE63702.1 shikimate kinase [Litoreibacter roseus]